MVVYSKYFDISDNLLVDLSAGDIDLENNINYTVTVTVSMNSGLTAEATLVFTVSWDDLDYEPNAEISFDPDTYSAYIRPYCEVEADRLEFDYGADNNVDGTHAAEYFNGVFIVCGKYGTVISKDGINWEVPPYLNKYADLMGLAIGDGRKIAKIVFTGPDGLPYVDEYFSGNVIVGVSDYGRAYVSEDGYSWYRPSYKTFDNNGKEIIVDYYTSPFIYAINDITYGDGKFVIVGNTGQVYVTENFREWMPCIGAGGGTLTSVTYGNGLFVAVGKNGAVVYSENGNEWESAGPVTAEQSTGSTIMINFGCVAYGNGKFVATGYAGTYAYSYDGKTWIGVGTAASQVFTNNGYTPAIYDIKYVKDRFIAVGVGNDSENVPGAYYSIDGVTWRSDEFFCLDSEKLIDGLTYDFIYNFGCLAYGNGRLIFSRTLGNNSTGRKNLYADVEYLIEDITLSVYRREFDGSFVEIMTGIENTSGRTVTDPHPSLDYARYRIVATDKNTGAVSYCDLPGEPVGAKEVVIQWNEDWSYFDVNEEDELQQPPWAGSMLKLPYNIDVSDKYSSDVSLINYIGRKRPVSYYGTQLGETSSWKVDIPKDDKETLYALRRLAIWMGDVYVREPSGSGYWANIKVSFSQTHCEVKIPVTIDITRVEGGM